MLRIAVIGVGHWGPNLIRNFHDCVRSRVTHVADPSSERRALVRSRFPDIPADADPSAAVTAADVDAVVIATPSVTHHRLTKAALAAGKHVLVEKPLATRIEDAEELCELAAAAGRVLMVGHVFLYNAAVRRVKELIAADHLGRINYIAMVRTNLGPIRSDVNAAWDLAAHDVSMANEWLGAVPLSVSAVGGAWINPGVEDAVFATLRYPGEVLASVHVSWLNPRKTRDITVVGERRMLTFDDVSPTEPLRIYDKNVSDERFTPTWVDDYTSFRAHVRDGDVTIPRIAASEPLLSECQDFVDCIERGTTPRSDGRVGLAVVRVLVAIERSLRQRGAEQRVS
jgi:predicted dehydrogenase